MPPKRTKRTTTFTTADPASPILSTSSRGGEREFNPDYTPVIQGLKRIGVLAGFFFVLLIALSFIIPLLQP